MANKLLAVTRAKGGEGDLLFREEDVRTACQLSGCDPYLIEACARDMREGACSCTSCHAALVNELRLHPECIGVERRKGAKKES